MLITVPPGIVMSPARCPAGQAGSHRALTVERPSLMPISGGEYCATMWAVYAVSNLPENTARVVAVESPMRQMLSDT